MSIIGYSDRFSEIESFSPGPARYNSFDPTSLCTYLPNNYDHHHEEREKWLGDFSVYPEGSATYLPVDNSAPPVSKYQPSLSITRPNPPSTILDKGQRVDERYIDKGHEKEWLSRYTPGPKYDGKHLDKGIEHSFITARNKPEIDTRNQWVDYCEYRGFLSKGERLNEKGSAAYEPKQPEVLAETASIFDTGSRFNEPTKKLLDVDPLRPPRLQHISWKHTRENRGHFSPGPVYNINDSASKVMYNYGEYKIGPNQPTVKKSQYWGRDGFLKGGIEQKTTLSKVSIYEHIAPGPGYYNTDSSFITKSFNTRVNNPRKVMSAKGRKRNHKKLPTVSPIKSARSS